jgi:LppX_LprAFG lipoprotein
MPSPTVVRRCAALLTACSLVALAGCGAVDASAGDGAAPGRIGAVERTTAPGSAADSAAARVADPAPGDELTAEEFAEVYRAALDQATTTHVTISSTGSTGISAEGDVDYGADPVRAALTAKVSQLGGEVELRLVDNVLYLRLPMLSEKFVEVDLDGAGSELGGMMTGPLDPTLLLGLLETSTSATYVGPEDVSGEQLDHYTVEVDPGALADQIPQAADLAQRLPDPVAFDVWFDDAGLLRTMAVDTGDTAGVVEVGFADWGQDVSVEAPPSDQVTSMPGLPQ